MIIDIRQAARDGRAYLNAEGRGLELFVASQRSVHIDIKRKSQAHIEAPLDSAPHSLMPQSPPYQTFVTACCIDDCCAKTCPGTRRL